MFLCSAQPSIQLHDFKWRPFEVGSLNPKKKKKKILSIPSPSLACHVKYL